jgi:hypothetical protein
MHRDSEIRIRSEVPEVEANALKSLSETGSSQKYKCTTVVLKSTAVPIYLFND